MIRMRFSALITLAQIALLLPLVTGQNTSQIITPDIDAFIQNILSEWGSPGGVSVAVVRAGAGGAWDVETKGYGRARLSDGANVTADTLFSIGSNSKLFTVVGTGLAIENKTANPRIDWNSKLADIIPDWELADPIATKFSSILDLMGHRTGLPRHDFSYRTFDTLPSMTKRLKYLRPSAEFREVWQYNNLMYIMLSYIAEIVTQTPFARHVKKNVFEPLGMNSTTYSFAVANSTGNLADGFARQNLSLANGFPGTGRPRALPYWDPTAGEDGDLMSGAGGVTSTANDLAIWLQSLLLLGLNPAMNQSVIPADVILRAATGISVESDGISGAPVVQSILSPVVYGGGQEVGTYRGHVIVEHGGDVSGAHSQIARLPFDNIGVAVLCNDDDIGSVISDVIKYRLLDEALGLEPFGWDDLAKTALLEQAASVANSTTPPPLNPTPPSAGFGTLSGLYSNPGYGNMTLCLVTTSTNNTAKDCEDLVASVPNLLPGGINSSIPTLLAKTDMVFAEYIKLQHFDRNLFNISALNSVPTHDPAEPFWAQELTAPGIQVEFGSPSNGTGIGIAITGLWGAGTGVPEPTGDTLEDRAEVWFDKVSV